MSDPNVNALWGRVVLEELARAGVDAVCVAPGSRSTPLVIAAAERDDVAVLSHLDERAAAFFALGRARRTGRPTPLVCTSGTAAAEFHPAVVEADRGRVPMVLLTADRPPALQDSGANQTVDQRDLYGSAVRYHRVLPEPAAEDRTVRSLRTTVARAVATSTGVEPGPVHLDVPFEKPLEPTPVEGDVPPQFSERHPLAARGRDGPYVRVHRGVPTPDATTLDDLAAAAGAAEHGLVVAGPSAVAGEGLDPAAAAALLDATGFPLLADPLSGLRFGPHVDDLPVLGGYDAYADPSAGDRWPTPDLVLRFGASPTSRALRTYLAGTRARQVVVDPAGGWREATFVAGDLVVADPDAVARGLADRLDGDRDEPGALAEGLAAAEATHWDLLAAEEAWFEGAVAARTLAGAPDPSTVVVSNSMPIRDVDRFAAPAPADLTVLGNRGASGIDGVTSTALGAGHAAGEPLVLLTGDLALVHDLTGLAALDRCGVEATLVCVNNDGGGIFHRLPVADYDPPFVEQFVTPHGLDLSHASALFGLEHRRVDDLDAFEGAYADALATPGSHLVEVRTDAEASHAVRDRLQARLLDRLA